MKLLFATLILSSLILSCDKEENDPPQPTKTEHISSAQWQYDNGGVDGDKNGTIDINFSMVVPSCLLDNKASFNTNGTGVADEGAVVCQGATQTTAFNWSFADNESKLNLTGSGLFGVSGQFDIVTLNNTTLSLRKDTTMQGNAVWLLVNLKH